MPSKLDKFATALILLWIGIEVGRAFGRDAGYMEATADAMDDYAERRRQDQDERASLIYSRGWSAEAIIGGIGLAIVAIIIGLYYVGR